MNGVHDMGGMHGFGPVTPEENEPVFHGEWEGRVMAMSRAMGATAVTEGPNKGPIMTSAPWAKSLVAAAAASWGVVPSSAVISMMLGFLAS